ncbi:peptidoglycan editing factor PgeF [Burkholderia sola]|uniref:peptidoglycan editing factor PgeF n=1 Tax=Burkholderia sola TaxID=2843302 RepID=UPI001C0A8480|nr:laccase [Burkholderia cenocepacia]CAG2274684.1 laccase [Burkholderia cenocepacia]CAG2274823.1 laccase [Burkholderia cenocepacia]CAG2275067.1 laccase [Burkholderia cenocepacia]CAG2275089.1 laccase [Burkholderia cenocepacia]
MTNLAPLTWQDCVRPDWRVSPRVRALITTRDGGVSEGPYGRWRDGAALPGGMNLGLHTGDDPDHVAVNRARVLALAGQSGAAWLEQVHGAQIVQADEVIAAAPAATAPVRADASVTNQPGAVCVVMVADCLPVLLCDAQGRAVGAAHAGWRGLAEGIVEQTAARVAALAGGAIDALHAYLGPAIGPQAFEVGADVRDAFLDTAPQSEHDETRHAFVAIDGAPGKFLADLYALARLRLARAGVAHVSGGTACTVAERARFYSYRRDRVTGRMAAAIWLAD